jgi:hypothetical protein
MKSSLKSKKTPPKADTNSDEQKRQPLSVSAARSVSKQTISYTVKFD